MSKTAHTDDRFGPSAQRGVFGYLPSHPDLVRVRASSREVRAMECWLERGLQQARWEMSTGFLAAYSSLTHRFVFRPDNSAQVLLGVLYASQDSNQRPFPFAAFELLPTEIWDRAALGLLRRNERVFGELEGLIQDVAVLRQLGQIHGRVLHAREMLLFEQTPASDALARDDARYQNFLDEVTCGELGLHGVGWVICQELIALLRGNAATARDPRSIRTAIEIPLTRPPLARSLEMRFYLEFCALLLAPVQPTWTLFWKLGGTEGGSLLICFREPTIDVFCALLRRDSPTRSIYRLGRAGRDNGAASSPEQHFVSDEMPLGTLLGRFGRRPGMESEATPAMR